MRRLAQLFRLDQVRPARPNRPDRPARLAAYNTYDARSVLSQLITRVGTGEEIVIARSGVPVAKLVPYNGERLRPGLIRTHVLVVEERAARHGHPYEINSSNEP
jgi:prevent-host-death family protein